jgi:hypothetical protein
MVLNEREEGLGGILFSPTRKCSFNLCLSLPCSTNHNEFGNLVPQRHLSVEEAGLRGHAIWTSYLQGAHCDVSLAARHPRRTRRRRRKRRRGRTFPAARVPSPRAAESPADSARGRRHSGLRPSAGSGGVRLGSALPPPWPMGRVGAEGRVSRALAALGRRPDRERRPGAGAPSREALDARPRL